MEETMQNLGEVVEEKLGEEEVTIAEPVDTSIVQEKEDGLFEEKEIETDSDIDEETQEDDIAKNTDEDNVDYWIQEIDNMLQEYRPIKKPVAKSKGGLNKTVLLVAGGGVAVLGIALVGVVAVKRSRRRRSIINTLPVYRPPEVKEEPVPEPPEPKTTHPPVPWPFFYFR